MVPPHAEFRCSSPFRPSVRPADPLPTQIRGLTVRFNGVPAGIIELNKDTLTAAVPPGLRAPLDFTVWQDDRQVQFDPFFLWYLGAR